MRSLKAILSVIFILIFCLTSAFGDGMTILSPPELEGHLISGPLALLPKEFNIEGIMAFAPTYCKFSELTDDDISKLNGKIVLFPSDICQRSFGEKAKEAMKWNATGVIMPGFTSAVGQWLYSGDNFRSDVYIPSISISSYEGERLVSYFKKNPDALVNVRLETVEKNPWTTAANRIGVFFQLTVLVLSLLNLAAAFYKFHGFVQVKGLERSVTLACLSLEIISNIMNLIYGVDMNQYRGIFSVMASNALLLLPIPITLSSTLLITFYWRDMLRNLSSYSRTSAGLNKMKLPFAIVSAIMFVAIIVSSALRASRAPISYVVIMPIIVAGIVSLCIGIFFAVTGYAVLKILGQSTELKKSKSKLIKRITMYFLIVAVSLIVFGISFFVILACAIKVDRYPEQSMAEFWWVKMAVLITSAAQIQVFQRPKEQSSSSDQLKASNSNPGTIELATSVSNSIV